ncbi:MAG: acyl carrier protein [Erysipelotrichaceae bacterium]|jgi:acyl carrier protein|nr:acyl carrier protein [Erysipelotrichaceae bacterium]
MNLVNEVLANFVKIAKGKEVTLESNVKELGLDSLDIVDLLMDMEEKYDIEFENEEMTDLVTVNDVVKAIEAKLK